jgi:FkbM family methyltransferase
MGLASAVYQQVRGRPALAALLEAVPMQVRLYDGRARLLPLRLWRLTRIWNELAEARTESAAAYRTYGGGDVLDVGAFEGWYSLLLAPKSRAGDTVLSIEPDPAAFPRLQATLAAVAISFPGRTFQPLQAAAGNGCAVVVSHPPGGHPQFAAAASGNGAPTVTVDELVKTFRLEPTFVKVDVEGAEVFVLEGMERTLAEHRPAVLLELHPRWQPSGVAAADVEERLRAAGYAVRPLGENEISARQLWTASA